MRARIQVLLLTAVVAMAQAMAAAGGVECVEADGQVILSNSKLRMVFSPARGGRCVSMRVTQFGRDTELVAAPAKAEDQGGLFGGKVLRNATIGGTVGDAEWTVNGTVVRLKAGEVDRLDLTADAVKTVIVSGDMIDASFDLQQAFARNTKALNRLAVTGTVADTDIRAIDNIGVVIAGQMTGSTVFAGVADGVTGLPGAPDFTALDADGRQATIKSFTIKGGSGFAADVDLLSSSFVAAGSIGRAKVRNLTTDNGGTSFGFSADSRINVLNWFEDTTKVGRFSGTSWASVPAVDLGDFLVQVV